MKSKQGYLGGALIALLGAEFAGLAHASNSTAEPAAAHTQSNIEWFETHPAQAVLIFTLITIVLYTIAFTYMSEIKDLVNRVKGKAPRRSNSRRASSNNSPLKHSGSTVRNSSEPGLKRSLSRGSSRGNNQDEAKDL